MFLRPQHFQATARHWHESLSIATKASDECSYGILRLDIDQSALADRQVEVRCCQARMRDGTLIWLDFNEGPGRLSLQDLVLQEAGLASAFDEVGPSTDTVRLYLAVPKLDSLDWLSCLVSLDRLLCFPSSLFLALALTGRGASSLRRVASNTTTFNR
jgi:hypothetical protein